MSVEGTVTRCRRKEFLPKREGAHQAESHSASGPGREKGAISRSGLPVGHPGGDEGEGAFVKS